MLASEIPADVHQFHRVECAAAPPGSTGGVRAFPLEHVLDRNESVASCWTIGDAQVRGNVREQADIDVFEDAGLNEECLRAEFLFRNPWPELNSALEMFALHDFLHRESREDVERHPGVVTLA